MPEGVEKALPYLTHVQVADMLPQRQPFAKRLESPLPRETVAVRRATTYCERRALQPSVHDGETGTQMVCQPPAGAETDLLPSARAN